MQLNLKSLVIKDARILIVDDSARNIEPLLRILRKEGYEMCIGTTDSRKAAAEFMITSPDLVILDWHMGAFSGEEFLQEIMKQISMEERPPVLVVTADSSTKVKRTALAAGASDFLTKPLDSTEALLRIHNLLHTRRLHIHAQSENERLEEKVHRRTLQLEKSVAELKEVQQQVIQQERLRALGTMAGGVAHDFNNALTVILGFSEMYTDEEDIRNNPGKVLDCFKTVKTAANDATEIVRRLGEFYRPYCKDKEIRQILDINEIVDVAVQLSVPKWQTQTRADGIFIDLQTKLGDVPGIFATASELREMMMNLIFNAVDAMPQGGRIVIRTGMEKDNIFIDVEDSGTGMTEETRRHCLEPFYTTKGDKGTGLGLAIMYGIIRRHNGDIRIQTELNVGTKVTILLPAAEVKPLDGPVPSKSEPQRHLKVLVVDDQPEICNVLTQYLELDAHHVVTAGNGCEALEKFRKDRFDLVITDGSMPKMNGDQLASAIKQINPEEPVILLTAFDQNAARHVNEVDLLVSKPVSLCAIREAIKKVIAA